MIEKIIGAIAGAASQPIPAAIAILLLIGAFFFFRGKLSPWLARRQNEKNTTDVGQAAKDGQDRNQDLNRDGDKIF